MGQFLLPIKKDYVPSWGMWECVREIIQNAKDEEDENGNEMTVSHDHGWLRIWNEGADMDKKALLLGQTTKASRGDLRGQFGEGLDLALLVAARLGVEMQVITPEQTWKPTIKRSPEFGNEECLFIVTRKLKVRRLGVEILIKMEASVWEKLRERFLFLKEPERMVKTSGGAVILDDEYKGRMYAKGIFVCLNTDHHFGYDFNEVQTDRDRRMIEHFELKWETSRMMRQAMDASPETFIGEAVQLLKDGADEVANLSHHFHRDDDALKAVVKDFKDTYGENALPVRTMAESEELEHYGKKGIVVSEPYAELLAVQFGVHREIQSELRKAVKERISWFDLDDVEKQNLKAACLLLDGVYADNTATLEEVQVVEFNDASLRGLCELRSGEIQIARRLLSDLYDTLGTLLHEKAHTVTSAGDGEKSHVAEIERVWKALFKSATI